jgi:hypothetical protein
VHEGELDIPTILQDFTLFAPTQKPPMHFDFAQPTFSPAIEAQLKRYQEWSDMTSDGKRVFPIRFCIEGAGDLLVTTRMIMDMIVVDGRKRGLAWDIVMEEGGITRLEPLLVKTPREKEEVNSLGQHGRVVAQTLNWMICFWDEVEAQRFVGEWHRKSFPVKREDADGVTVNLVGSIDADCLL